jgi:DNA modification methylase
MPDLNTITVGDCLETMRRWPDGCVQCAVTSPPYYGLRDYGTAEWDGGDPGCDHLVGRFERPCSEKQRSNSGSAGHQAMNICPKCGARRIDAQIGLESTPDEYLARMAAVFGEVRRVLREDGCLWLNMGDGYNGSGAVGGAGKQHTNQGAVERPDNRKGWPGLKPKDLLGMPWRLAMAMQADGWYWRAWCPWVKRNPMPESVQDRPTTACEVLFLFSKSESYFYDAEAVKVAASRGAAGSRFDKGKTAGRDGGDRTRPGYRDSASRARRQSDWFFESWQGLYEEGGGPLAFVVNPKGFSEAHFATFPEKLVEPCLRAGTSERGACPQCGKPWERVVEVCDPQGRLGKGYHNHENDLGRGQRGVFAADGAPVKRTLGWRAGCSCEAGEPVPCVILDPFMGAGTTAVVAERLGRSWLGCELNPEYVAMANRRLAAARGPLFAGKEAE